MTCSLIFLPAEAKLHSYDQWQLSPPTPCKADHLLSANYCQNQTVLNRQNGAEFWAFKQARTLFTTVLKL
jgi:hypothetical protein